MSDIIFGFIVITLIIGFILYVIETNKEKAKLVNALIAKTPEQARDLNLADKVVIKPIKQDSPQQPDLIPLESMTEDEFDKHIGEQLNQ